MKRSLLTRTLSPYHYCRNRNNAWRNHSQAEIGDINRFDKPKQLIAYAGMDPSVKQSGNFVGTQSHMSKRGSPYLRRALWLAAVVAVNHDDLLNKPVRKLQFQNRLP